MHHPPQQVRTTPNSLFRDCFWLALLVAVTRFLFRSHFLYDLDSVNFALALERFDPAVHQPHPPGYFLYVWLGRLVFSAIPDANLALVTISVVASCGAAVMIYALAHAWFGRMAAIGAGIVFLFSPLCWFHGTVALTYIVEAFFSALIGYLCWRGSSGRPELLVLAGAALGVSAGFRQSSLLLLGPLWLFSLRRAGRMTFGASVLALGGSIAAWVLPMLESAGGAARYFAALQAQWSLVRRDPVTTSFLVLSAARIVTIAGILGLCFASGLLLLRVRPRDKADRDQKLFTWVWVAPGLLFFSLVFLRFVNSGYLLVLTPPLFVWLGRQAAAWFGLRRAGGAVALAGANVGIYLFAPVYCSHQAVRKFEAELAQLQRSVRRLGRPDDTLIIGFDSHFQGYRHAGYYLPEYLTVEFPEVPSPQGKRVFAMHHRSTTLRDRVPLDHFRKFVLFPLPPGKSYDDYISNVRSHFRQGAIRVERLEGREFLVGSSSDAAVLFPSGAAAYTGPNGGR